MCVQVCSFFTFTFEANQMGCCYLKSWSRTPLTSFPTDIGGQTYARISPPNVVPCNKLWSYNPAAYGYSYNETGLYKCINDCECSGTRICSRDGYCMDRGNQQLPDHPTCSKFPGYQFIESSNHRCSHDCDCDGTRVCSTWYSWYCGSASSNGRRALNQKSI